MSLWHGAHTPFVKQRRLKSDVSGPLDHRLVVVTDLISKMSRSKGVVSQSAGF